MSELKKLPYRCTGCGMISWITTNHRPKELRGCDNWACRVNSPRPEKYLLMEDVRPGTDQWEREIERDRQWRSQYKLILLESEPA
jgi:hypothetical protein